MTTRAFTDEQLMAFADGEADAQTSLDIKEALRSDPNLAKRIAVFTATGDLARRSFALKPVPTDLEARIRDMAARSAASGEPVSTPRAQIPREAANSNRASWHLPLAASILLAIGLAGGYLAGNLRPEASAGLEIAGLVDPAMENALQTVPAGSKQKIGDDLFIAIASFKNEGGQLCREFERDFKSGAFIVGVACLEDGRWSTQAVIAAARSDTGYAPASSMDAIEAYISAIGAGPVLGSDEEAAELSKQK
jgi:hypothetical protein